MSLRPRYSLLTLLVLTALVAGGVKLWYGPHRVESSQGRTMKSNTHTPGIGKEISSSTGRTSRDVITKSPFSNA